MVRLEDIGFWQRLLDEERAARAALDGPERPKADAIRKWWRTVRAVLFEFEKRIARNDFAESPPVEVLQNMSRLSRELSQGIIPIWVKDAAVRGNPSLTYLEARDIGFAVAYAQAATEGIEHNGQIIRIEDKSHNRTIREAFCVDSSTARSWRRKYPPTYLGINSVTPKVLTALLVSAGKHYQNSVGRSRKATTKRNRKGR